MIILYYNTKGLNIINNNENILYPFFNSNFINLYDNNLFFNTLLDFNSNYEIDGLELFQFTKNYNIIKKPLDFPYLKSFIHKNFSYYEFPKYYSPTFDYENCEHKYFLGVYQTVKNIRTGEDSPIINFVVFLSDKNTGEIIWYWEMDEYFIKNNLSLNYDRTSNTPIIHSVSRIGKNNLELNENDIMLIISQINQILFIEPFTGIINKTINISDIKADNINSFTDAHLIPEGLPGEGNLLFYSNSNNLLNAKIIEYDVTNEKIIFEFENEKLNNNDIGGSVQKLINGNYFIFNYENNILLEVDSDKNIIFEFNIDENKDLDFKNDLNLKQQKSQIAIKIPKEWASNFIKNRSLIELAIKNYK